MNVPAQYREFFPPTEGVTKIICLKKVIHHRKNFFSVLSVV